jgi:hypothetical protein
MFWYRGGEGRRVCHGDLKPVTSHLAGHIDQFCMDLDLSGTLQQANRRICPLLTSSWHLRPCHRPTSEEKKKHKQFCMVGVPSTTLAPV